MVCFATEWGGNDIFKSIRARDRRNLVCRLVSLSFKVRGFTTRKTEEKRAFNVQDAPVQTDGMGVFTLGICEVMRGASPRSREEGSLRNRESIRLRWYWACHVPVHGANVS